MSAFQMKNSGRRENLHPAAGYYDEDLESQSVEIVKADGIGPPEIYDLGLPCHGQKYSTAFR